MHASYDPWLVALVVAVATAASCAVLRLAGRYRRDAMSLAARNAGLHREKELLTLAIQAAGIGCWEYDLARHRMLWTENEIPSLKSAGLAHRDLPEARDTAFLPADLAAAEAAFRAALAEGRSACALRMRVLGPAGKMIHLQTHARLYADAQGNLARLLGVSWDVTEQVLQEERRLKLQVQLREASRQAGMAEVATGVLHSVGNVLNSLGVSATVLASRLRDSRAGNLERAARLMADHAPHLAEFLESDPRGRELPGYLQQLGEHLVSENRELCEEAKAVIMHVEHIGRIVAAQQAYARQGASREELEISELMEHALTLHFPTGSQITLRREYGSLGRAVVDRHRLLQILANLLSNARHALRDRTAGPKVLTLRLLAAPPGSLLIEVEDSGVGISGESMKRLFEFGFTTKKDGHGFGLHSSAILAKELGGELTARSEGVNRGACFTLRLPMEVADIGWLRRTA